MPPAVDGELETRKALFLPRIFLSGGKSPSFLSAFYSEGGKKAMLLVKELVLMEEFIKHLGAGDV